MSNFTHPIGVYDDIVPAWREAVDGMLYCDTGDGNGLKWHKIVGAMEYDGSAWHLVNNGSRGTPAPSGPTQANSRCADNNPISTGTGTPVKYAVTWTLTGAANSPWRAWYWYQDPGTLAWTSLQYNTGTLNSSGSGTATIGPTATIPDNAVVVIAFEDLLMWPSASSTPTMPARPTPNANNSLTVYATCGRPA